VTNSISAIVAIMAKFAIFALVKILPKVEVKNGDDTIP
jgi:hypothetical protein